MDISLFRIHTPEYHAHVSSKDINSPDLFILKFLKHRSEQSFPRTGPQDLLVTHYDCEENEQKILHKYAINQVTQCESEPQPQKHELQH